MKMIHKNDNVVTLTASVSFAPLSTPPMMSAAANNGSAKSSILNIVVANFCTSTSGVRQAKTEGAKIYRIMATIVAINIPNLTVAHANLRARSFR